MDTYHAKPNEIEKKWHVVDLKGKVLGRAASKIANILRGKHKPVYTPHVDTGDFVIVLNANQIRLTGNKLKDKMYYSHSGYIGGLKEYTAEELLRRNPEELIYRAVKGMLPKNRLARQIIKKLKIYAGEAHPHSAQQPQNLEIE